MRIITFLAVAGLAWPAITPAAAEDAGPGVARMRRTPLYAKSILDAAYATPAWAAARCEHPRASLGDALGIVEGPIKVDARGLPLSGAWIEHVSVEGCGQARQLNVLAYVQAPGTLATVPLLPGETRADPLLQKDGSEFAFRYAAIVSQAPCENSFVADTAFAGQQPGQPVVPGKPGWLERWAVDRCGKRVEVQMRFTPDATGTSVNAGKAP